MQTTAVFTSTLTANVCLMLAIRHNLIYSRNVRIIFLAEFHQVFYKSFMIEYLSFTFFVVVAYYTLLQE